MDFTLVFGLPEVLGCAVALAGATWAVASFHLRVKRMMAVLLDQFGGVDDSGNYREGRLYKSIGELKTVGENNRRAINRVGAKVQLDPFDSDPLKTGGGGPWESSEGGE